jgi:hypothetical protein
MLSEMDIMKDIKEMEGNPPLISPFAKEGCKGDLNKLSKRHNAKWIIKDNFCW